MQATTIAQVADAADVPPGNVYYYFKSKDDLVLAVVDLRCEQVRGLLDSLQGRRTPGAGSRRWRTGGRRCATSWPATGARSAPCRASWTGRARPRRAAAPLELMIDWAETQFRDLGRRDARELAVAFVSGIQGGALLSNAFRDPDLMSAQVRHLERWIDSLAGPGAVGVTGATGPGRE